MSPLPARVVLDNTVISSLHIASSLRQVLELWAGFWLVPLQVRAEAAAWKGHGPYVVNLLDDLDSHGVLAYVSPEPGPEGALFAQITRTRGEGESAAIAIAHHRQAAVATDDRQARRSCQDLNPPVPLLATEELLTIAVADSRLAAEQARALWSAIGITDPNRGLGL